MTIRDLFPPAWAQDRSAECSRKETARRRATERAAEAEARVAYLRGLLDEAPEGEIRQAVAGELAAAQANLVKAQGRSDKILREISALKEQGHRQEIIWSWLRG